jgi:hypothetical protein
MLLKAALAIAALVAVLIIGVQLRTPRADRNWVRELSRAPSFENVGEGRWLLHDLRAFEYKGDGAPQEAWRDTAIDEADLAEIWFFVEPFEGFSGAAHTLVSFVFAGETNETIAMSVEARKEQGEVYSGVNGLFNKFELIYQWATEKDLLTRIAVELDHEIYAYRLNVTEAQAREILVHFIERTNELAERPRFYNTFTSNCTNELAKAAKSAFPQALPWHYSHILTGYSAERLHDLGFLGDKAAPFEELKTQAAARGAIRAAAALPETSFSESWRQKAGLEILHAR